MDKRICIICNTFYQVLMAIQFKTTIFKNDVITLVATDKSPIQATTIDRLKKLNYFENVYFIRSYKYCQHKDSIKEKLSDVFDVINGNSLGIENPIIADLFLYYNFDLDTLALYADMYKTNPNIQCARYEEGIFCYNNSLHECLRFKAGNRIRKLLGKRTILQNTKTFYCYYPSLYHGFLNVVEVPRINTSGPIGKILEYIFDIHNDSLSYNEKYIYFSSVCDFEGGEPIGELDLVRAIRDRVGNDHLLVKVHPRDTRTVYTDENFHVDKNSKIPWEAIQLNIDCSDKVFITANSGSVLSVNMLIDPMPRTVFAYECCHYQENPTAINTINSIKALMQSENCRKFLKNVQVIRNVDEL